MEPYPQFPSQEDSQTSRSRPQRQLSLAESSAIAIHNQAPLSSSSEYDQSTPQQSPAFSATSSPPLFAPLPLASQNTTLQGWSYIDPSQSSQTPLLRLDPAQDQVIPPPSRSSYTSEADPFSQSSMTTMGVQYYPPFDASLNRSAYSWPVFDQSTSYQDGSGLLDPFAEQAIVSSDSRSISSSPPQGMFTTEQRELKRQRDQARRDSKAQIRRDRSSSNSYHPSLSTTPDILPRTLTGYSQPTTSASISSINLPLQQPYMSPPQIPSTQSPELYQAPYPIISNDFSGGYLMPYTTAPGEPSIPSLSSRPVTMPPMTSGPEMQFYYGNQQQTNAPQESPDTVRVVHSRPKPQCWDHDCNGRKFSTFSNLLRHQREKSGMASKPICPKCGAEFTRTTARNGHMAHEKCKQRRNS
ncbi:hypothetical protein V501_06256 [Pseudogymnoascus sp. VKM F-4519 (FW-2642)]|nr:hypothetical protein V501_06256 [Pseudogymnoascus sp. VKM F-4519 (FW-2642)]